MNFETQQFPMPQTQPVFLAEAQKIVTAMKAFDAVDIAKRMKVSRSIAEMTHEKYQQWGETNQPAVYAYKGDVYKGFYADTLSKDDLYWANRHVMILSGLYGVLRLSDEVGAYRLEMGLKVSVSGVDNLYDFWGSKLAQWLEPQADGVVCILSSQEYAKPITSYIKKSQIVIPVFTDNKANGKIGPVPIYSKMMRGVMARWIIDNKVDTPQGLRDFSAHGYRFDQERSTLMAPVFYRNAPKPLVFDSYTSK